jgi:hypothetical protein
MGNQVSTPAGDAGIACPQCGRQTGADARFCDRCGFQLPLICRGCGAASKPDANFCSSCGTVLARPAPAAQRDAPKSTPSDRAQAAPEPAPATARRAYTPAYVAGKILTSRSALEGERKLVTVVFADVVNSSAIAQQLDPEHFHSVMGEVLQLMAGAVHRYEGTVN